MPRESYRPRRDTRGATDERGWPMPRRPHPLVVMTVGAIFTAAVAIVIAIPLLVKPVEAPAAASAVVSVVPTSAAITLGRLSATGELKVPRIEAGPFPLRISRKGFEPVAATLTVVPGKPLVARYVLKPLPQQVAVVAHTGKARVTVRTAGGVTAATGKFRRAVPSGPITVTVEAPGYAPLRRELFLDEPLTLDVWLDPPGQLVRTVSVFRSVPSPKGVAVTPDGSQMWVTALVTQPSIEAYDRSGRVIGRVDLGSSGAVEVIFSADGTKAYASQMQSASVFEIDTRTYKVLRRFGTGSSWTKVVALSPDGKTLYAANWSGDDVSVIDLATGKLVRRFPTVDTPRGLWPTADGRQLWVAGFGEQSLVGRIAVIDLGTGKSRTVFSQQGGAMRHMVADEGRGVLFTSDMGKAVVWATDMRTGRTTRFVKTDSHPNTIDLSPDGKVLFVSNRGANNPKSYYLPGPEWGSVELFDAVSGKGLDAIVGGNQTTALDLSADGRTLVFSDFLDARLHVYEVPPYATLAAGKGGRFEAHARAIRKPGWRATRDDGPDSGD